MTSKNNFHNIGLVGAGEFGSFASKVIKKLPRFRLYAVLDTNEKAAKDLAKAFNAKVVSHYAELLGDPKCDIIMINTPNYLHGKMTIQALNCGKKVLCEKPLFISRAEGRKVKKALVKSKGVALVNVLLPHSRIYQRIKKTIKNKTFGNLRHISIKNLATESTIKTRWYWDRKKSGGWFLTADIHFYDLLLELTGDVKLVGATEHLKNGRSVAIYTNLACAGASASIFHSFDAGYDGVDFKADFIFENAQIQVNGWVPVEMRIRRGNKVKVMKEETDRESLYQSLVGQNFLLLDKATHADSLAAINRAITASEVAFKAEKC
ncbi:MAG: Gfo/Idh/MocA family oxidoreductase [Magnetococcus sp. WYHC-3]